MPSLHWFLFLALACSISAAQEGGQPEKDPHRPPCTSAQCRKIKSFLKAHYCGESPFGNGPDDGCDMRRSKLDSGTKVTADYVCEWNEMEGKSHCRTEGEPTPRIRQMLLREMHHLGMPQNAQTDKEVRFRVLESPSGWSAMAASYDHTAGLDLTLCEIVMATDQSGQSYVLRKVPIKKTNVDVPDVTTWSPVDIADTNGDRQPEIVLEGDAYEDHWFEVVRLDVGSFKTIFSGLGYYL